MLELAQQGRVAPPTSSWHSLCHVLGLWAGRSGPWETYVRPGTLPSPYCPRSFSCSQTLHSVYSGPGETLGNHMGMRTDPRITSSGAEDGHVLKSCVGPNPIWGLRKLRFLLGPSGDCARDHIRSNLGLPKKETLWQGGAIPRRPGCHIGLSDPMGAWTGACREVSRGPGG